MDFVLVGSLLTLLTFGVLQVGIAIYARNVIHDAAITGAYHAALADTSLEDGATRTWEVLGGVGSLVSAVDVSTDTALGYPAVTVRVDAALPVFGLIGLAHVMEVTAHAPLESLDPR